MKRYPIGTTVSAFENWLNDYGAMKQQNYLASRVHWGNLIRHEVTSPDNHGLGEIHFHIERDRDNVERFYITTELWNGDHSPSRELVAYLDKLAEAIRERWPQNDLSLAAPVDPATWVKVLEEQGIAHGSSQWWEFIEQWTLEHWRRKGRRSLPITPTLETFIGYKKTRIYEKTSLSEYSGK
jgi:hypothetical protein